MSPSTSEQTRLSTTSPLSSRAASCTATAFATGCSRQRASSARRPHTRPVSRTNSTRHSPRGRPTSQSSKPAGCEVPTLPHRSLPWRANTPTSARHYNACSRDDDGARAHQLAAALAGFWDGRSLIAEARRSLELTLATSGAHPVQRATLLNWPAYFCRAPKRFNNRVSTRARVTVGVGGRKIHAGIGYAQLVLGRVAAEQDRLDDAITELAASEQHLDQAGDTWGIVRPINALGEVERVRGQFEAARAHHLRALAICQQLGEQTSLPSILCDIAHVSLDLGDTSSASEAAEEAIAIATQLENMSASLTPSTPSVVAAWRKGSRLRRRVVGRGATAASTARPTRRTPRPTRARSRSRSCQDQPRPRPFRAPLGHGNTIASSLVQSGFSRPFGRSPVEDGSPETNKSPADQGLYRGRGGT